MPKEILKFENVSASYGPVLALNNVSLTVCEHEIVTLIGSNGAGKSTLMMSVFGYPRIQKGNILFENNPIQDIPTHKIASLGIAISPERRRLFEKLTVEENLNMGILFQSKKNIKNRSDFIFSLFPILADRRMQDAGTLSGGEQQMLSIGRALMSEPKLLLLDEPSLGLAPQKVEQLFSVLKTIAKEGTTLFLVEQNAYQALRLADRGYIIVNGEIKLFGVASELANNPHVQSLYFGESV